MIEKYGMMFLDEDDGGGGGGGEAAVSRGMEVFEGGDEPQPPTRETQTEPAQVQPQAPPSPPPSPTIDARQFATEFGNVLGQQFRPPPKEITVQDAKRLLNVWEPSPEWQAKYDNLETRNQAIAEQRDGLIRQADTIMQFRMREMMDQVRRSYDPVVRHIHQAEARASEGRFSTNYPELSSPNLRPMLFAVAQNLLAQGARFKNEKHMFETVARGVESIIKVNNPEFKLGNGGTQPRSGARQARSGGGIPVTTPGSGAGGSGSAEASPGKKPRGLAIWDS